MYTYTILTLQRTYITVGDDDDSFFATSQHAYTPVQRKITSHLVPTKAEAPEEGEEVVPATQLPPTQPSGEKKARAEAPKPKKSTTSEEKNAK